MSLGWRICAFANLRVQNNSTGEHGASADNQGRGIFDRAKQAEIKRIFKLGGSLGCC